jgi:hypothetical protein
MDWDIHICTVAIHEYMAISCQSFTQNIATLISDLSLSMADTQFCKVTAYILSVPNQLCLFLMGGK